MTRLKDSTTLTASEKAAIRSDCARDLVAHVSRYYGFDTPLPRATLDKVREALDHWGWCDHEEAVANWCKYCRMRREAVALLDASLGRGEGGSER